MRRLFIDDGEVAQKRDVARVIHPGRKRPEGAVLAAAAPWEDGVICGGTVRREAGGYRMWYQSYGRRTYLNLYATSSDGITWERPALGQYPDYDGQLENNIFLSRLGLRSSDRGPLPLNQDHIPNVLFTPHQREERAYTLFSYDYGRSGYAKYDGYFTAFSRDGIVWTDGPRDPVIPGYADVGWFTYDAVDGKFRAIVKTFLSIRGHPRRSVLATESPDGFDWTLPRPALLPDQEDDLRTEEIASPGTAGAHTQFYGMPIFRYESLLLGFLQVFRVTDPVTPSHDGPVEVQLACSRDGHRWERVGDRQAILALGAPGTWDAGGVYSGNSLVADGDEVRLYYSGTSGTHAARDSSYAVGFVSWLRDRFVGLAAGSGGGTVELKPQVAGRRLHLNADAANGSVEVTFRDSDVCTRLEGDSLDHRVEMPPGLSGQTVATRLRLTNAELFSFWWA